MLPSQTVADLIMNESIDRLRSHFGLTQAEARLALHLVAGETLRSAAAKLSIRRAPNLRISSIKREPVGKLNLSYSSLPLFLAALERLTEPYGGLAQTNNSLA